MSKSSANWHLPVSCCSDWRGETGQKTLGKRKQIESDWLRTAVGWMIWRMIWYFIVCWWTKFIEAQWARLHLWNRNKSTSLSNANSTWIELHLTIPNETQNTINTSLPTYPKTKNKVSKQNGICLHTFPRFFYNAFTKHRLKRSNQNQCWSKSLSHSQRTNKEHRTLNTRMFV